MRLLTLRPVDRRQQFAHLMSVELAFDVARETLQPAAQHIKILTEVFDPQSVGLGVMAPYRLFSRFKVRASCSPILCEPS